MRKLFVVFFALLVAQACTVEQEIHFNEDFSGSVNNRINLSMMTMLMGTVDTLNDASTLRDSSVQFVAAMSRELMTLKGISHVEHGWQKESSTAYVRFDFDNLNQLNQAFHLINFGEEQEDIPEYFTKGWFNTLRYSSPKFLSDSLLQDESISSMKDYFGYKLIMDFAQPVKKVKHNKVEFSNNHTTITKSGNLFDVFTQKEPFDMKIKLD